MTRPKHVITSDRKKRRKVSTKTEVSKYAKISRTDDASVSIVGDRGTMTRPKQMLKSDKGHGTIQPEKGRHHYNLRKKRRKLSTKIEVSKYDIIATCSSTDEASDLFMDESRPRTRSKSKTKYDKEQGTSQPEEGQRHDVLPKGNMSNIPTSTLTNQGTGGFKTNVEKGPTEKVVPRDIPDTIKGYETYNTLKKGKYVWICNFKNDKEDENIVRDLKVNNISELFTCKETNKMAFTHRDFMMWEHPKKTCKSVIVKELKEADTDCFICILSSCSDASNIFAGEKKESIDELAFFNNEAIHADLIDRPKILIFDLYDSSVLNKCPNSTIKFHVHKDWLFVFARNKTEAQFIKQLKHEIDEMHDKLDFVSILERVKNENVNMKIIHRMPRKLFLKENLETMKTDNMSYFDIKGVVNCCFFGSKKFRSPIQHLKAIEIDKAHVFSMSDEFQFSSDQLKDKKQTIKSFKDQLNKDDNTEKCGCHMFVFSSHGSCEGIMTRNLEIVQFNDFLNEIDKKKSKVPVVLVFDCCRTANNKGNKGDEQKDNEPENDVSVAKRSLKFRNVIVVYAAVVDNTAMMDTKTGSHFIKTMCSVIKEHRLTLDFLSMMECVNAELCKSSIT